MSLSSAGTDPSSLAGTVSPSRASGDGGQLLAQMMSYNAIVSIMSGVALIIPSGLNRWMGADRGFLLAAGIALIVFAGVLVQLMAAPQRLRAGGRAVVAADVAWVASAVALTTSAPQALSSTGDITLGGVTLVVAVLAVGQWIGLRRIGAGPVSGAAPHRAAVTRVIPASADRVWDAVADAGNYAEFVDGIAATEIVAGEHEGMVRVCTDDRGGQWNETCTLWEEGRRYRMTVDVASYPPLYRALLHEFAQTWELKPVPGGTRVTLRFDTAVKLGVIGRLAVRAMARGQRLERILDAYQQNLA